MHQLLLLLKWLMGNALRSQTRPAHASANEVCKGGRLIGAALTGLDCLAEAKAWRSGGAWKSFVEGKYLVISQNLPSSMNHWAFVEGMKRPRKKKRNMAVSL